MPSCLPISHALSTVHQDARAGPATRYSKPDVFLTCAHSSGDRCSALGAGRSISPSMPSGGGPRSQQFSFVGLAETATQKLEVRTVCSDQRGFLRIRDAARRPGSDAPRGRSLRPSICNGYTHLVSIVLASSGTFQRGRGVSIKCF